ncbi:hypothetical protein Vadar_024554 [Vaccinium darrowii]|uniref:Uncharacterized protein n=1 Tax=Vaccinium darrowii TaxID=229202 RepID=A0ACB7YHW7_9ERIC|nr:hypothetical protein Vadar_024554 [Vaccinium darrowii]
MADQKVTTMVLKVDLQCPSCYKKVRKILAKFPQIRSQAYDEKQNTVTITVVCCNPEKFRDKLCCKGGKTIKTIEILEPPKPKPKPKEPEKPKPPPPAVRPPLGPRLSPPPSPPRHPRPAAALAPAPAPAPPVCVPAYPMYPVPVCCGQCYEGIPGGPCYQGYGRPVPSYDGYGYGGSRACYASRCDEYFSEENATGCTIM